MATRTPCVIRAVFDVATAKPTAIAAVVTSGNILFRRSKNAARQSPIAATAAAGKTGHDPRRNIEQCPCRM